MKLTIKPTRIGKTITSTNSTYNIIYIPRLLNYEKDYFPDNTNKFANLREDKRTKKYRGINLSSLKLNPWTPNIKSKMIYCHVMFQLSISSLFLLIKYRFQFQLR